MATDEAQSAHPWSSTQRYGSTAIAFHWITVALIVGVGVLGLLHDSWPRRTQPFWINIHALLGLLVGCWSSHGFGIRSNRAIFHPTEDIHGYLAYALFALVGIHALTALWHHFIRHDGVLRRMWPSSASDRTAR
jgi:cytochrome b561